MYIYRYVYIYIDMYIYIGMYIYFLCMHICDNLCMSLEKNGL